MWRCIFDQFINNECVCLQVVLTSCVLMVMAMCDSLKFLAWRTSMSVLSSQGCALMGGVLTQTAHTGVCAHRDTLSTVLTTDVLVSTSNLQLQGIYIYVVPSNAISEMIVKWRDFRTPRELSEAPLQSQDFQWASWNPNTVLWCPGSFLKPQCSPGTSRELPKVPMQSWDFQGTSYCPNTVLVHQWSFTSNLHYSAYTLNKLKMPKHGAPTQLLLKNEENGNQSVFGQSELLRCVHILLQCKRYNAILESFPFFSTQMRCDFKPNDFFFL